MFQIKEISGFSLIDKTTSETVLQGDYLKSEPIIKQFKNEFKNDEIKTSYNRDLNITLSDVKVDKDFVQNILKDAKPSSVKMITKPIPYEKSAIMTLLGFKLYPIKKNKNKRVQKKWSKKYGFRAVRNINVNDMEWDKEKSEITINKHA